MVSGFWCAHGRIAPRDVQGIWQTIHSAQRRSSFWATLTLIVAHSPPLRYKAGGEDTRFATCMSSQMDTPTRFGSELFNSPPSVLPQSTGRPRVCSSDENELVDLAQVLGVRWPVAWTSWQEVESDFDRWLRRLLTMARTLRIY